jgi:hypothetical protein
VGGDCARQVPWCLQRRFIDKDTETLQAAHGIVDETRGVVVFNRCAVARSVAARGDATRTHVVACMRVRFCHVYKAGELRELFESVGGADVDVREEFFDKSNWCLVLRKAAATV